jgi:membrane associated rhomboid family serine protease
MTMSARRLFLASLILGVSVLVLILIFLRGEAVGPVGEVPDRVVSDIPAPKGGPEPQETAAAAHAVGVFTGARTGGLSNE